MQNLTRHFKIEDNVLLPGVLTKEEFSNYLKIGFVQHSVTGLDGRSRRNPVAVLRDECRITCVPLFTLEFGCNFRWRNRFLFQNMM
jgi:hypothetical protein